MIALRLWVLRAIRLQRCSAFLLPWYLEKCDSNMADERWC